MQPTPRANQFISPGSALNCAVWRKGLLRSNRNKEKLMSLSALRRLSVIGSKPELYSVRYRWHWPESIIMNRRLYNSLHHVVVESLSLGDQADSDMWGIDDSLRTVALRTPSFRSTPMILAETDLIATIAPERGPHVCSGRKVEVANKLDNSCPNNIRLRADLYGNSCTLFLPAMPRQRP